MFSSFLLYKALDRAEIGASRDQFRRLCLLVDADIWPNVEHDSSSCAAAKGRVARFFESPLGTVAVSVAIVASLVQVYLDATTRRGSAGFYVWTIVGLALLVLFSLESARGQYPSISRPMHSHGFMYPNCVM